MPGEDLDASRQSSRRQVFGESQQLRRRTGFRGKFGQTWLGLAVSMLSRVSVQSLPIRRQRRLVCLFPDKRIRQLWKRIESGRFRAILLRICGVGLSFIRLTEAE